jgi:ABC-type Fe3+/spermidine/putrescine transport system ATPase subunit
VEINPQNMLEVTSATKSYSDVVAVDNVSLNIREGELFSIVGPSGAGKSTVLHSVAGLQLIDEGTISIDSEDVTQLPPYERDTATVFQSHALFPHMSVKENIAYGLKRQGATQNEIDEKVKEYLELVELTGYGGRSIGELSGGEQQRVALVRSLIKDPKVLLLDEPLSSLDQQLRVELRIKLHELQRELNQTAIYVTHDQNVALSISDRIAVMNEGKVEQVGTPYELYNDPKTEFVSQFIGSSNSMEGEVVGVQDGYATIKVDEYEVVGRPNSPVEEGDEVSIVIKQEDIRITGDDKADKSDNYITGVIQSTEYQGKNENILVKSGRGIKINAITTDTNKYKEGDSVGLNWSPNECIIFGDGGE